MSIETTQESLIGEPDGTFVEIETNGRVIKPLLALPDALVDELRLRVSPDGLEIRAVDPANVGMIQLDVHPEAFDAYTTNAEETFIIGLPLDTFTTAVNDARHGKTTKDDVSIRLDSSLSQVEIRREYDGVDVAQTDEFLNIDSDSVREEPDLPDLEQTWRAEVSVDAFKDTVTHLDESHDYAVLEAQSSDLTMTGGVADDDSVEASRATFAGVAESLDDNEPSRALYSTNYLMDLAKALKRGKVDDVEMLWDEEFPIELFFERTIDGEIAYEGHYMMAPRIQT